MFDIATLTNIIAVTYSLPHSLEFQAIYLLVFFGVFLISNLVPSCRTNFSHKQHLCRGDVIYEPEFTIIYHQTKSLQNPHQGSYIIVPKITNSVLCPVTALQAMSSALSLQQNNPLFSTISGVVTQAQV